MKKTLLIIIITGICGLISCSNKKEIITEKQGFCLTDSLKKKIELSEVKMESIKNAVQLSGKIEADEDKWIKVYPVVNGVVTELKVNLGDYVTKGQTLAVIRSSEIADYQGQLLTARSSIKIAEKNLDATTQMAKSGLATDKDVIAAQTDLEKARADLRRMEETNDIYGSSGQSMHIISAPASGYIVEKNVTDQMQFRSDGSQPFFTIANLDDVWVIANVFESDIANVKQEYDADVHIVAYKDSCFKGKVDRIFSILDPQSRVMKVRIVIPNKNNLLKPEMSARINITHDDNNNLAPSIPASAVVFDKNKNYVMVYKDDCNIETREIEILKTAGNTTYIQSGLSAGEKVISKYQLLVYDAMND